MGTVAEYLLAINRLIMKNGTILNLDQQVKLCAPVTIEEIIADLKSIGADKAPGVDTYNAKFFTKAWPFIQDDVIEAVRNSFETRIMYRPINCTAVALVPKSVQPITIKEYRPISCCSVLYNLFLRY